MTLKEKVKKILHEKGPLTLKEIHAQLPNHSYHSVAGRVYELVYSGEAVRLEKGRYALAKEDKKRTGRKAKSERPAKPAKNQKSNRRTKSKPKAQKAASAEDVFADAISKFAEGFGLALTSSKGGTHKSPRKSYRRKAKLQSSEKASH